MSFSILEINSKYKMILIELEPNYPSTYRFTLPISVELDRTISVDILDGNGDDEEIVDGNEGDDIIDGNFSEQQMRLQYNMKLVNSTTYDDSLALETSPVKAGSWYSTWDLTLFSEPTEGQYQIFISQDNVIVGSTLVRMVKQYKQKVKNNIERHIVVNEQR